MLTVAMIGTPLGMAVGLADSHGRFGRKAVARANKVQSEPTGLSGWTYKVQTVVKNNNGNYPAYRG